jgi:hypothetical protein
MTSQAAQKTKARHAVLCFMSCFLTMHPDKAVATALGLTWGISGKMTIAELHEWRRHPPAPDPWAADT